MLALEHGGRIVRPSSDVLRITQDRLLEKSFVRDAGFAVAPFVAVRDASDLPAAFKEVGLPAVIKTARGGYDGKGQWVARSEEEAYEALAAARGAELIFESFIPFDLEVSVICARDAEGTIVSFPVTENVHDHGVLATTIVPARVSEDVARRARETATSIGARLGIVGAYCVEFFVAGNDVYVNEIAPRVHNSGHYSLDAAQISQYEAHVRAICGLPLVPPKMFAPAVMENILGAGSGDHLTGIPDLLRDPDTKLHLYGKRHAALRRKMGHFTVLGTTIEEALVKAERGRKLLAWSKSASEPGLVRAS